MKRRYHFQLPYFVPGMYISMGRDQLVAEGVWNKLPKKFRAKLDAATWWSGVNITKEDCDSIDDASWKKIAAKLGLKWEYVK